MPPPPDFDPFELLGVDASADAAMVDRAYKARIRYVHPDIAGAVGLEETKRLNIAREWLLDPELRAQLPPPKRTWRATWTAWRESRSAGAPQGPTPDRPRPQPEPAPSSSTDWYWDGQPHPPPRPEWDYDPEVDDPLRFDYGTYTEAVQSFFGAIRGLTSDERARVTYCLGDEPPLLFDQFEERLGQEVWARSLSLEDAIDQVWGERVDETRPLLFPRGRIFGHGAVVANAYAQWLLLADELRALMPDQLSMSSVESRCTAPWAASVGHPRYGTAQREVVAFLDDARVLPLKSGERLARSWERHMGDFLYGRPGEDWFPGAPERPNPQIVSARLAAVDASRIDPPEGLPYERHNAFRCGLRLTAYVLALGESGAPGRDYLRPWRDAMDASPSFIDRARWGMPTG